MNAVGKPHDLRVLNQELVESIIRKNGTITKPEISRITGLSLVTVGKVVETLEKEKRIVSLGQGASTGGRTAEKYSINKFQYCFFSMFYNNNSFSCSISNALGDKIFECSVKVDSKFNEDEMILCIEMLLVKAEDIPLAGIGIGVPGVVDDGLISNIPELPALEGVNLTTILETRFECLVSVENDINLAAWGIYREMYRNQTDHIAFLYLDNAIGCGLVINRKIFKGASNYAGEIGNLYCRKIYENCDSYELEKEYIKVCKELSACKGEPERTALKSKVISCAAAISRNITCMVDPGIIIIKCNLLEESDLNSIADQLEVDENHRPQFVLLKDIQDFCMRGVLELCMHNAVPMIGIIESEEI
ncbi:MAG: ROK family transcriptional regulator [Lachnospiraceae bacterium]|nr:ROK family transcriptional regulator [Lachnospiraceae bacterium]